MSRHRFHGIKTTALAYHISDDIIPAAFIHLSLERKLQSAFSHKCYYVGNSIIVSEWPKHTTDILLWLCDKGRQVRRMSPSQRLMNGRIYSLRRETASHPYSSLNISSGDKRYFLCGLWGPNIPHSSLLSSPPPAGEHPLCFQEVLLGVYITYNTLSCSGKLPSATEMSLPGKRLLGPGRNLGEHGHWRKRASASVWGGGRSDVSLFGSWNVSRGDWSNSEYMTRMGKGNMVSQWVLSPLRRLKYRWPDIPETCGCDCLHKCVMSVWCLSDGLANWPKCKPAVFLMVASSSRA